MKVGSSWILAPEQFLLHLLGRHHRRHSGFFGRKHLNLLREQHQEKVVRDSPTGKRGITPHRGGQQEGMELCLGTSDKPAEITGWG